MFTRHKVDTRINVVDFPNQLLPLTSRSFKSCRNLVLLSAGSAIFTMASHIRIVLSLLSRVLLLGKRFIRTLFYHGSFRRGTALFTQGCAVVNSN